MAAYNRANGANGDERYYNSTSPRPSASPYDTATYNTSRPASQIDDLYSEIEDSLATVSSTSPPRNSEIHGLYSSSPPNGSLLSSNSTRSHARSNSNLSTRPLPLPSFSSSSSNSSSNFYSSSVTNASNNLLNQMGSSIRPLPQVPADDGQFWKSSPSAGRRTGNSYPPIDTADSSYLDSTLAVIDSFNPITGKIVHSPEEGGFPDHTPQPYFPTSKNLQRNAPPPKATESRYLTRTPTITTTPPQNNTEITTQHTRRNFSASSLSGIGSNPKSSLTATAALNSANQKRQESFGYPSGPSSSPYFDPYNMAMGIVDEYEVGADDFFNPALLSNIALHVKDKVPKGVQIKGAVEYPRSFTGKDVVGTVLNVLPVPFNFDRRLALTIARYLQDGLFFHEVDWSGKTLRDGVDDVYIFDEDEQKFHMEMGLGGGSSSNAFAQEENILGELPTGVLTKLTNCYSPFCNRLTSSGLPGICYSTICPNRISAGGLERAPSVISITSQLSETSTAVDSLPGDSWAATVPADFISQLDSSEVKRQELIFELISSEREYLADFDFIQTALFEPIRSSDPPIIPQERLAVFFEGILDCVLNIREYSKVFFESLLVKQREQTPLVRDVGPVILGAAVEWGDLYIRYAKNLPFAMNLVKIEKSKNPAFDEFVNEFNKNDPRRRDIPTFQQVPTRRLSRYSLLIDQLVKETPLDSPDREYLIQALDVIKEQCIQMNEAIKKGEKEAKRQLNISELIEGEEEYWKDLDFLEKRFVTPLYQAQPPIIGRERLKGFLNRTLSNVFELRDISMRTLDNFRARQREEGAKISMIGDAILPMLRPVGEAYIAYVANSPFSDAALKDEAAQNTAFKAFLDECSRHPDAKRLPISSFLTRPTFRVPRLPLLIKEIADHTDPDSPDRSQLLQAMDIIKEYLKKADETISEAKLKYTIIEYNADIIRKPGDGADLDLLNPARRLFHRGTMLRKPDGALGDWTELHVVLFDNYLVMTKPREQRDGKTKFYVSRRAIPLELLQPLNFSESASLRTAGLQKIIPGGGSSTPSTERNPSDPYPGHEEKSVYPLTFRYLGRHGEIFTLHVDTKDARTEWQKKIQEAIAFRQEMLDASKVFTLYAMSDKTFGAAPYAYGAPSNDGPIERHGPPTCSCPISTSDNRRLVAIGCADGVWIGLRSNPQSLRRVIHLNDVTQLAVLQQFGFLLVLSEKRLFAYPLEVVIPTANQVAQPGRTPQQISGEREVLFFKVGKVRERTLVTYCKRATSRESLFIALEPVASLDHTRPHASGFMRGLVGNRHGRPEYFRTYKDFFVPSESYSIQFLRSSLAILCKKGVEIMNLETLKPTTVPDYSRLRNDPRAAALQRRCDDGKALGMFRLEENVFLICYSDLAFWTDKYGDPIPQRYSDIFDWEGAPQTTVYQPPHILAFDSNFIEIRNAFTGKLVQIIKGEDIVCTYDGSGGGDASRRSNNQPLTDPGEGRVHVSIKVDRKYHKIFELIDTRNGEPNM